MPRYRFEIELAIDSGTADDSARALGRELSRVAGEFTNPPTVPESRVLRESVEPWKRVHVIHASGVL